MPPPGAPPEIPLEFTPDQDRIVLDLARQINLAALVSAALGGVTFASGLVLVIWWFSLLPGIFALLVGIVNVFLGLVLLSTATDIRFIAETKGADKIHLMNGLSSLSLWLKTQLGLAVLVGVVFLFRLFI